MLDPLMWALYAIVLYISFFLMVTLLDEGNVEPEEKELEKARSVSLIIPAYNEEETIQMTIESALQLEYPGEYDVIVVNDGSEDKTLEKAKEYSENNQVTVLDKENGGKASALNKGVEESDAEIVGCVDADSKLRKESLTHMVAEMGDEYEGVASAMKVQKPENMIQKLQWVEYIVGIFTRNIVGLFNGIHVTPGPLSIYKKDKLIEVGKFDEDSLVEDQEICFRLQEQHYKIGHSSKGEVHTVAPATIKEFYKQRYRWYRGSLETVIQYKDMLFNREYGDFGMFAIPSKLAQTVLSIFVLFLTIYLIGLPITEMITGLIQIGPDYITFNPMTVQEMLNQVYWGILGMQYVTMFSIGALFSLSVAMAYMASQHTEENLLKNGVIPVILYLAFFVFINGALWLIVIIKMIAGSERSW